MKINIAAVIVTYNRKKDLQKCIEALLSQTFKLSSLYIVDNASKDNTFEFFCQENKIEILKIIESKEYCSYFTIINNIKVNYLRLQKNLGGAGGFNLGMSKAYENKADYIWVMDDDGCPSLNCLENLILNKELSDYLAPLVLNIENNSELAFKLDNIQTIEDIPKNKKILEGFACPFNGILYSKKMIKKIGVPQKELFIWGDESEYHLRAKHNGFNPITIISAKHYHPKDRMILEKNIFGNKSIVYPEGDLRKYCKYRNEAYTLKKYEKNYKIKLMKKIIEYTYFFTIQKKMKLKDLGLFYKAYYHGIKGNLLEHARYVK
ncbi:glycosyltransferase, group 2 family protein [Cetobacterium somerae ATCC BAA-474]|uniref:Glycosyltransferase, group 2 family protein n=1 Tax=Cetobacterium somerae ATCC BAA-474 TaxID=1319815 RepID=U7V9M6_9FUSO|nr:glycosyltransferase [Cetobacterium somerae]ERT67844.1 glycosyltransferase, group 2 family protein [Cetobacterium somerae ATCC BAA-474]